MNAKSWANCAREAELGPGRRILLFSDKLFVFTENMREDLVMRWALQLQRLRHVSDVSHINCDLSPYGKMSADTITQSSNWAEKWERNGLSCWPECEDKVTRDSWDCNIYCHINLDEITRSQMSHKPAELRLTDDWVVKCVWMFVSGACRGMSSHWSVSGECEDVAVISM